MSINISPYRKGRGMRGEEAPMRIERARFLSVGEESEIRMGADFIAGEISVLMTPHPSSPFTELEMLTAMIDS